MCIINLYRTAIARGLFDYDLNGRSRNKTAKLIVKHFNTSIAQHYYQIKMTKTWIPPPYDAVSSGTVDSFKNNLNNHWEENPPDERVNW